MTITPITTISMLTAPSGVWPVHSVGQKLCGVIEGLVDVGQRSDLEVFAEIYLTWLVAGLVQMAKVQNVGMKLVYARWNIKVNCLIILFEIDLKINIVCNCCCTA